MSGLVLSGSDFAAEYVLFSRPNDTPAAMREGMVRFENASDVTFTVRTSWYPFLYTSGGIFLS